MLDLCSGCGGNAISFARNPLISHVLAVEYDIEKCKMAYHNATLYEVQDKITWINGNCVDLLLAWIDGNNNVTATSSFSEKQQTKKRAHSHLHRCIDLNEITLFRDGKISIPTFDENSKAVIQVSGIFFAPPWGGLSYLKGAEFSLSTSIPLHSSSTSKNGESNLYQGIDMLNLCHSLVPYVCSYLPRSLILPSNIAVFLEEVEEVSFLRSCWIEHVFVEHRKESMVALLHSISSTR